MKTNRNNEGFVLTAVMMLIVIASLVGGAFLVSARGTHKTLAAWKAYDDCLLAVQAGLEQVNYNMYTNLISEWYSEGNDPDLLLLLANQDYTVDVEVNGGIAVETPSPMSMSVGPETASAGRQSSRVESMSAGPSRAAVEDDSEPIIVTVTVVSGEMLDVPEENRSQVLLTCKAVATYGGVTRAVEEVVDYSYNGSSTDGVGGGNSDVFDYVFFIDNVGWFSGVNADFNGDIGANLDIDLKWTGSMKVNGDCDAGGECVSKKLYKSHDWDDYGTQAFAGKDFVDKLRPALYTDYNRNNPDTYYEQGYAEGVTFNEYQEQKELPFIGPLSAYEEYATAVGGSASDANTTVDAVWGDDLGEDAGVDDTSVDDGCLILIGTRENPINLNGVVVVQKDLYIKGFFTGQGTIYAGRNINIVGDIVALDGPTWDHPDSNPVATAEANKTKDFLGLCAKGCLLFGNHNCVNRDYIRYPYTSTSASDASDAGLGYVSGHRSNGQPYFDGDYAMPDGDGNELRTDGSVRLFYEPILAGDALTDLFEQWNDVDLDGRIGQFDCVMYANHLIAGSFQPNTVLNGAMICRDEAVVRHGNLAFNWDARLGSQTLDGMAFFSGLPGNMLPPNQPMPSRTVQWAEVMP